MVGGNVGIVPGLVKWLTFQLVRSDSKPPFRKPACAKGAAMKARTAMSLVQKANIDLRPPLPRYASIELNITPPIFVFCHAKFTHTTVYRGGQRTFNHCYLHILNAFLTFTRMEWWGRTTPLAVGG